ncbi:MAG: hypothetical protein ABFD62_11720 [Syntrophaceae bacterium]
MKTLRSFEEAEHIAGEVARSSGPKKVSVVGAESREFLLALKEAYERGYAEPLLIGDEEKIRKIAGEIGFDISKFDVFDERASQKKAERGVQLALEGQADFILRAWIEGPPLYRTLIRASSKKGRKKQICAVGLMQFRPLPKLIGVADIAITVAPDFSAKMGILKNAMFMFSRLGYDSPQVGIIATNRELNDRLDSISDAGKIREAFAEQGLPTPVEGSSLSDFLLGREGFLEGFDKVDYSRIPDILLVHNLDFGNVFVKIDSMGERDIFTGYRRHAFIMGAGIPIVIPSRSDSHKTIITDIALGVLVS